MNLRRHAIGTMRRLAAVALLLLVFSPGCKAKTTFKDSPQTLRTLEECEKAKADKDDYIKQLEKELAQLKMAGTGEQVMITIAGDEMTISGKGPNGQGGVSKGDAADKDLYEAYQRAFRRSRGKIKKCYQNALKKNAALQSRTVTLDIQVSYRTDGAVSSAQFSPKVSSHFDTCMRTITKEWNLPAMPKGVTFSSKISLTPE